MRMFQLGTERVNTHHSIYGHVKESPRSHDVEDPVDVLKNRHHHLILIFGCWPETQSTRFNRCKGASRESCQLHRAQAGALLVLGVCAGVNDAIHVQVQVVELHLVGVGFARVDGDLDTIALLGLGTQQGQGCQHKQPAAVSARTR